MRRNHFCRSAEAFACLFHRADDANDGEHLSIVSLLAALTHTLADRAAVRPVAPRKVLVDHAGSRVPAGIGCCEEPPYDQGEAQSGEIVAGDAIRWSVKETAEQANQFT